MSELEKHYSSAIETPKMAPSAHVVKAQVEGVRSTLGALTRHEAASESNEKLSALYTLVQKLESEFNYDFVAHHLNIEHWIDGEAISRLLEEISHVIRVRMTLLAHPERCEEYADATIEIFEGYQKKWQRRGLLSYEASASASESVSTNLERAEIVHKIQEAIELIKAYRTDKRILVDLTTQGNSVIYLLNSIPEITDKPSEEPIYMKGNFVTNDALATALRKGANQAYQLLPQHHFNLDANTDYARADLKRLKGLNEFQVSQTVVWHDETGTLTKDELRDLQESILRSCPPAFFAAVQEIQFVAEIPGASRKDCDVTGDFGFDLDRGIGTIRISMKAFEGEHAGIKFTLLHELGHAGHNTLPMHLLKAWRDQKNEEEHIDVSDYLARLKHDHSPRLEAEDFADSFLFASVGPLDLQARSPARYEGMRNLVSSVKESMREKIARLRAESQGKTS